jgi:hypothetical protein
VDGREFCRWCEVNHVPTSMGEKEIRDFFYDEHGPHLKTHIYETLYIT